MYKNNYYQTIHVNNNKWIIYTCAEAQSIIEWNNGTPGTHAEIDMELISHSHIVNIVWFTFLGSLALRKKTSSYFISCNP